MAEGQLFSLAAGLNHFVLCTPTGQTEEVATASDVFRKTMNSPVLLCNRALMKGRLGVKMPRMTLDVLELFAFVCPACTVVPTTKEIALFLKITSPIDAYAEAKALISITRILLSRLASISDEKERKKASALALTMTREANWIWGNDVLTALGTDPQTVGLTGLTGYAVWEGMSEWSETVPASPAGTQPVTAEEAKSRLAELLSRPPENVESFVPEERKEQVLYAQTVAKAFSPRMDKDVPVAVLAEAGTGIGKTLGYLSAASVWGEKNAGSVWISTYTRNLQRQLDSELARLYPDPQIKRRNVVVRKGRENYICLLNFAEAVGRIPANAMSALPLGIIARWVGNTKDGDLNGGDFPGWLNDMLNQRGVANLADKRGECIYSQCPHYKRCFIEKAIRRSRHAKIVVANHALVMTQLAGMTEDTVLPTRYIFDEGHQLFNAADSIFAGEINIREGLEMRRCLIGSEEQRKGSGRVHGIKRRIEDLMLINPDIAAFADEIVETASFLPKSNALSRLKNRTPQGLFEKFLTQVYRQVLARAEQADALYSLECEPRPVPDELTRTARELYGVCRLLEVKTNSLVTLIENYVDEEVAEIESADKQRYLALMRSLKKTVVEPLAVWRLMLEQLNMNTPPDFVDWLEISRAEGVDVDVGYHRHWIDPTIPFAHVLRQAAHGVLITSATLKDKSGDDEKDWINAGKRTGVEHFKMAPIPFDLTQESYLSPFDYEQNSRVFIVTDVDKNDAAQVAAACRELFLASQGGGLGIFTAIKRLKAVYQCIREPLAEAGLPLMAQHIDTVNLQTLLDIFKSQEEACLLGTDAVRDGIDVPGKSLRLILFDRVPWHRPDIAHKARKAAFGESGETYNLMLVRMKMAQAFGRLIRKKDDRGVFVMLDRAVPSETLSAFPEGTPIEKLSLKETILRIKEFL